MKDTLFVIHNNGKWISDPHRCMILLLPWELRPPYGSWVPTGSHLTRTLVTVSFTLKSLSQLPTSINSKGLLGYGTLCLTSATSCQIIVIILYYLNDCHEAKLDECFVQEVAGKEPFILELSKLLYPVFNPFLSHLSPPALYLLVCHACSCYIAPLCCSVMFIISTQMLLDVSYQSIICTYVCA